VAEAGGSAPIDAETLAVRSGTTAQDIARLVDLHILIPSSPEAFDAGDVSRARFALALEASGISLEDVATGIESGHLSFAFAGRLMAEPVALRSETWGQACARVGMTPVTAQSFRGALGLPAFDPAEQIREDDAELLELWADAMTRLSEDMVLRGARVFATSLRPLAEFRRELFADQVEEPMLAAGMQHQQMLDVSAPIRAVLQPLSFRVIDLIDHRLLEREVFDNLIGRFERAMEEAGVARSRTREHPAIAFVDVSGFTKLVASEGDDEAARVSGMLTELAMEVSGSHRGRLVKGLGDGVLLRFDTALDAVAGVRAVFSRAEGTRMRRLHAGIATGPVVIRDGDYFGTTVNLASRITDRAQAGEILTSAEVVEACAGAVEFELAGDAHLKGIGVTPIFRVVRAAP